MSGRMPAFGGEERMRIYLADIRPLFQEKALRSAYRLLDEARQEKVDAQGTVSGKAASAAAGLLMRHALEQNGMRGTCVKYTSLGQPVLEKGYISVSHSGIYAVCVFARTPVGVDIQEFRRIRAGMLRRCLTEAERFAMERKGEIADGGTGNLLPESELGFLRYFSAKESYMKLTGQGMSLGFDRIEADLDAGTVFCPKEHWPAARLYECPAPEGYVLTACRVEERNGRTDAGGRAG